jgi:hypothetical protein
MTRGLWVPNIRSDGANRLIGTHTLLASPLLAERGLRGVYAFVVLGLRSPPRPRTFFGFMRLRATTHDLPRHPVNARNEGVPGSSPGVGSVGFAGISFAYGACDARESSADAHTTTRTRAAATVSRSLPRLS